MNDSSSENYNPSVTTPIYKWENNLWENADYFSIFTVFKNKPNKTKNPKQTNKQKSKPKIINVHGTF